MVTYKFKYAITDKVWTMLNNRPVEVEIHGHKVKATKTSSIAGNLIYEVSTENYDSNPQTKHENELFKSKATLLKSL